MKAISLCFAYLLLFLPTVASAPITTHDINVDQPNSMLLFEDKKAPDDFAMRLHTASRATAASIRVYGRCSGETIRRTAKISPSIQSVGQCGDSPNDCSKPVKFMGESRAGCACFACEYGRKTQKIRCTKNEADKTTFKRLLPKTKSTR